MEMSKASFMDATTFRNMELRVEEGRAAPEAGVVGAVCDVEYGGHVDGGGRLHLLKQRLKVPAPAEGVDGKRRGRLLSVPEMYLRHGARVATLQQLLLRLFGQHLVNL
jgi:hypothetical protein